MNEANDTTNVEILKSTEIIDEERINNNGSADFIIPADSGILSPQYSPEELTKYYQLNSYHQRCIQTKALVTAGLGFDIISSKAINEINDSEIEIQETDLTDKSVDSAVIEKFIENNESATGETFIEMMIKFQTDFEVFGYAFLEVARDKSTHANHLYHIPAKYAFLSLKNGEGKRYLQQKINGKTQSFSEDEFLMINNYNPDNRYYGLPEYISALPAIMLDREMMEFNISRIQNNAIPDLIVSVSGTQLTREQKETMKEFWKNNFKGAGNSGKTLLIETAAKDSQVQVTEIKSTYRDGAFRLAKRECRDEIIACHGVPPILLGIKTSGGLGSGKDIIEQMRTFKEIIIEPRQRRLEHLLNNFFRSELGVTEAEVKFKNIKLTDDKI